MNKKIALVTGAASGIGRAVTHKLIENGATVVVSDLQEALIKPGPDLVVCDEGHRIKNSHASISQALKNIRTK